MLVIQVGGPEFESPAAEDPAGHNSVGTETRRSLSLTGKPVQLRQQALGLGKDSV